MQTSPLDVYRRHCAQGRLAYQVCTRTGRPVFYPRVAAPGTGAPLEWRISAGLGTVYATTAVHPRGEAPHNVALVDLDEGFRMMSRVEDCDPRSVRIGQRMRVRFAPAGEDGVVLPVFVPDGDAA